jgi:hypothetical protein
MASKKDKFVSIDDAAAEFKVAIDKFVVEYKKKHEATPEMYPLSLPMSNAGLWTEFMLDFHNNGIV